MGHPIQAAFDDISVTTDADQDIWQFAGEANHRIRIVEMLLRSEVVVAENLRLQLRRITTGITGDGQVEVLLDEDDGLVRGALTTLATTPGSAGALIAAFQWDQRAPLIYRPPPLARPILGTSGGSGEHRIALHLETALAATTLMSGYVIWETYDEEYNNG